MIKKFSIFFLGLFFLFLTFPVLAEEKVDINSAHSQELERLTGVGPVIAQRIIEARPFSSVDDLIRVKGIGQKKLKDIKEQGLAYVVTPPQSEPEPDPEPEPKQEPEPESVVYPLGIVINEILPYSEGPDEKEEWIEIFNQNNFEVDISSWKIEDKEGKTTAYVFPAGTKINSKSFLVFSRPTTKITLNNDLDGLNLIWPNGNIIDTIAYEKTFKGQSYNKINGNWVWSSVPTPGSANIIPEKKSEAANQQTPTNVPTPTIIAQKSEPAPKISPSAKTETSKETSQPAKTEPETQPEKIDINTASAKELQRITGVGSVLSQRIVDGRPFYSLDDLAKVNGIGEKTLREIKEQGLAWVDPALNLQKIKIEEEKEEIVKIGAAAIGQTIPKQSNPIWLFFLALGVAVLSAITIIIFKKKLKTSP